MVGKKVMGSLSAEVINSVYEEILGSVRMLNREKQQGGKESFCGRVEA